MVEEGVARRGKHFRDPAPGLREGCRQQGAATFSKGGWPARECSEKWFHLDGWSRLGCSSTDASRVVSPKRRGGFKRIEITQKWAAIGSMRLTRPLYDDE